MKTASDWLTDSFCLIQNKGQSGLIDAEGIRQIQLDAFKAGMTRATDYCHYFENGEQCEGRIIKARDNLKEI